MAAAGWEGPAPDEGSDGLTVKLQALELPAPAPGLTVVLDATPSGDNRDNTALSRWGDLRRTLRPEGADGDASADIDAVTEALGVPVRTSGEFGRVLVASGGQVVLDRLLPQPPGEGRAVLSDHAHAFALAGVADATVRYLLVSVDRDDADLALYDASARREMAAEETLGVEGGHDELTKTAPGFLGHKRVENRAEDSWERNAQAVAGEVNRIVRERGPELVLLTGDHRARALVHDALGQQARELTVEVSGGGRADGVNARALREHLATELTAHCRRRRTAVLDRFRQEEGRDGAAVTGLADVVEVLRKGQVAELLLTPETLGPPSRLTERSLWIGAGPLQVAMTEDELHSAGVDSVQKVRADLAIGRAVLDQQSGITVAPDLEAADGVAALLRWRDSGTPGEHALAGTADSRRV